MHAHTDHLNRVCLCAVWSQRPQNSCEECAGCILLSAIAVDRLVYQQSEWIKAFHLIPLNTLCHMSVQQYVGDPFTPFNLCVSFHNCLPFSPRPSPPQPPLLLPFSASVWTTLLCSNSQTTCVAPRSPLTLDDRDICSAWYLPEPFTGGPILNVNIMAIGRRSKRPLGGRVFHSSSQWPFTQK